MCATGVARVGWGADGKVIIERLCIRLPYVETFNSKVIKGFVPELRSRYVFLCFGIPMFYEYIVTWSAPEMREIRNFPYPSVFELTGPKG